MNLNKMMVIDLTARYGAYALKQLGFFNTEMRDSIYIENFLGATQPGSAIVNWHRPDGSPAAIKALFEQRDYTSIVLIGPGSFSQIRYVKNKVETSRKPVIFLVAPNAIVEDAFLRPIAARSRGVCTVVTLPSSDPEAVWLVLMSHIDMLAKQGRAVAEAATDSRAAAPNLKECVDEALAIEGALAIALVDYRSGMCLAQGGCGIDLDLAAAENTQVVKAKLKAVKALGLSAGIEDILITLGDQFHIMRLVPNAEGLFLYLVLEKNKANLAIARYRLTDIERKLRV